jgi:hypothetical protein
MTLYFTSKALASRCRCAVNCTGYYVKLLLERQAAWVPIIKYTDIYFASQKELEYLIFFCLGRYD